MREELRATALLLRAVDYGESDRVVTLLTREAGKLSAFARAARASRRRFGGALEPFQRLAIRYRDRRGDRVSLAGAEIERSRPAILSDYDLLVRASYLTELASEATRERERCPELFDLLDQAYETLSSPALGELPPPRREGWLAAWEVKLLDLSGYRPRLDVCGNCEAQPGDSAAFRFVPASGGVLCGHCAGEEGFPVSASTLGLLDGLPELSAESLPSVLFDPRQLAEAKALTATFLRWHLGKELKSARFLG